MSLKEFKTFISQIPLADGSKISPYEFIKLHKETREEMIKNKYIPELFSRPLGCQLELTYKCNQRCIHCYNNSGTVSQSDEELKIEEWIDVCHQLVKLDIFQCIISGGEPTLLGDDLFILMDILAENNVSFIVISNGLLIDKEKAKKFSRYRYDWFQISIDGSRPEIHDYIRGCKSWHKAIKAVTLLKEQNIPVIIAHTVSKINKDYLDEMIELAFLLGADGIIIGPTDYLGRAIENIDKIKLSPQEYSEIYNYIIKRREENQGRIEIIMGLEEVLSLRLRLHDIGNDVLLIRPNGDVKFDCIAPFKIGNVKNESLIEIWEKRGKTIWQNPEVQNYITQITQKDDFIKIKPRPGIDPDKLIV